MKDDLYIKLLLKKCISFKNSKSLFISYYVYNEDFVNKFVEEVKKYNITDIYLECIDPFYEKKLLEELSLEEIEKCGYFDNTIYNDYARKNAAFIMFVSPYPEIFNDIDDEKLALVSKIKSDTRKIFRYKEINNKISWSIVPLYNKYWEDSLDINNLQDILYDICLVDKNYLKNWDEYISKSNCIIDKINNLKLDKLHFTNEKGTDLYIKLNNVCSFEGASQNEFLANLPSYEIFTSPDRLGTNGIVYNSRPLYYNGGIIDDFYLVFKDGKVIDFDAKKGKDLLKSIIFFDSGSSFLGEVALVETDSPISKTGITFKTTLLDENASCHLAFGCGFGKDGKKKMLKNNINFSDIHVDFMFGTDDLNVEGIKDNNNISIMEKGKFVV